MSEQPDVHARLMSRYPQGLDDDHLLRKHFLTFSSA